MKYTLFTISDIFDVQLAKGDLKESNCEKGQYPLISSGTENYGIVAYTNGLSVVDDKYNSNIFKGNCITLDMFCNAFYRDKDFYAVSHGRVNILIPKIELNKYHLLYICTILNKERYRYSYGRAIYSKDAKNIKIYLPATEENTPDWQYIENYIKSLNIKLPQTKNTKSSLKLNISNWKYFNISDIFIILNGKGITREEIDENKGIIPVVQSGSINNAIIGFIDLNYCKQQRYTFTLEPCLTVARSGTAGFITLQSSGCVVGDSAKILQLKDNKYNNIYILIFLKTILSQLTKKYTYGRKVTQEKYYSEKIKLPVIFNNNSQYIPDWQYMENYIKSLPYGDII